MFSIYELPLLKFIIIQINKRKQYNRNLKFHGFDIKCPNCNGNYCDPDVRGKIYETDYINIDSPCEDFWECGRCKYVSRWSFGTHMVPINLGNNYRIEKEFMEKHKMKYFSLLK